MRHGHNIGNNQCAGAVWRKSGSKKRESVRAVDDLKIVRMTMTSECGFGIL